MTRRSPVQTPIAGAGFAFPGWVCDGSATPRRPPYRCRRDSNEERPSARKVASIAHFRPESAVEMPLEGPILQTETRLDRIFDPNSFHRAAFTSGEPPRPTLFSDLWTSPMTFSPSRPDRTELASGLEISRVVTGLWQVADMERRARSSIRRSRPSAMRRLCGGRVRHVRHGRPLRQSPKIIAGRFLARVAARERIAGVKAGGFTKWCPKPGPMTARHRARRRRAQPATAWRRSAST